MIFDDLFPVSFVFPGKLKYKIMEYFSFSLFLGEITTDSESSITNLIDSCSFRDEAGTSHKALFLCTREGRRKVIYKATRSAQAFFSSDCPRVKGKSNLCVPRFPTPLQSLKSRHVWVLGYTNVCKTQ